MQLERSIKWRVDCIYFTRICSRTSAAVNFQLIYTNKIYFLNYIIQSREKSLSQSDHKIHSKMVKVEAKRPSVNRRGGGGGGDQRSSHNRLVQWLSASLDHFITPCVHMD